MTDGALAGEPTDVDVVVIGGGQSALAVGFYLRRTNISFVLLDDQPVPGGAWTRTWPSLTLFSPAQWSSLPGYLLPRSANEYPTRAEIIAYLTEYERRYALPVMRPVHVERVERDDDRLVVIAEDARWRAGAVVSATGTWANPVIPCIPGQDAFRGIIIHSARYAGREGLQGKRVLVVGGGNSGAQIAADLSDVARVTWVTLGEPRFLPDEIDGRYLFEQATARYHAMQEGRVPDPPRSLGDIVAVASVRAARARGALTRVDPFVRFTERGVVWPDGREEDVDAVVFATGFRPALAHLASLGVVGPDGRVATRRTHSVAEPRLWLVGYGEWTGFASATLIGVGRSARATVEEIVDAMITSSA